MRAAGGLAIGLAVAACGGRTPDPIDRLARAVPATAELVVAIDGARVRGTWIAAAARSLGALIPADHACLIDAGLAADRAVVADLPVGRIVALVARKVDCKVLSQVTPGLWIATLGGASAPAADEPRLADRPDYRDVRRALAAAPITAVAPDGIPVEHVLWAAAAITDPATATATVTLELDTAARADTVAAALRTAVAGTAEELGDGAPLLRGVEITAAGTAVIASLRTDARTAETAGPVAVVAAVAAVAARQAEPVTPVVAPACVPSTWPIECSEDGTRYAFAESLRATIADAVEAAKPVTRVVGGQPAGVRITEVAEGSVLGALGLRTGDIVIALHGRRLDTREAIDAGAERLRRADRAELTILRGPTSYELHYRVE